jgi:hypothetical protein
MGSSETNSTVREQNAWLLIWNLPVAVYCSAFKHVHIVQNYMTLCEEVFPLRVGNMLDQRFSTCGPQADLN